MLLFGDGAVIGAGAVRHPRLFLPNTIVTGIPASPLRRRFSEDIAVRLQALAWWSWDHTRIRAALDDFRTLSVEEFLEKHGG